MVNNCISQPTTLFQKWDVKIFGQSPDVNFICQHTTLTESLSRFLFLPLKSKVFQPEVVGLAPHQFLFTSVRLSYVKCFVIKQNSLFPKVYVVLRDFTKKTRGQQ